MKILVTGACGWIGRRICIYLASTDNEVIAGDLTESEGPWTCFRCLDITRPLDIDCSDVNLVIHCAGYAHRPNETADEQKMFYTVNRNGTQNVLDWCERQGVERFLYVSSIAFYEWAQTNGLTAESGDSMPALQSATHTINQQRSSVAEDHPISLPSHYAKSKYEGEQLVSSSSLD